MNKFSRLKINCGSLGSLVTTTKSNNPPSDKDWKEFFNYISRNKETLTERQKSIVRDIVVQQIDYDPNKFSETVRKELCKIYAYETFGKSSLNAGGTKPYTLDKGNLAEQHSIEMLSRIDGVEYIKNDRLISNRFLKGVPDILIGGTKLKDITGVKDIKTSYDLPSFLSLFNQPCDKDHSWQMQGYIDILQLPFGEVCHCLVNMPEKMMNEEIKRVKDRYELLGITNTDIEDRISILKNSMMYDDIPEELRVIRYTIENNQFRVRDARAKVKLARTWLLELHNSFQKILPLDK